jgi:hypothetical protein
MYLEENNRRSVLDQKDLSSLDIRFAVLGILHSELNEDFIKGSEIGGADGGTSLGGNRDRAGVFVLCQEAGGQKKEGEKGRVQQSQS